MDKIIHKSFNIPIYFGQLHIFIYDDFKFINEKFNLHFEERFYNGYESLVGQFGKDNEVSKYFIALKPKTTYKIIVHESIHIVNYIFDHRQIQLDLHNDEPQAYFTGWVFNKIVSIFNKDINLKYNG